MAVCERLARAALTALRACGVVLFCSMTLLVLAQVVARKFFEPLVWSEELARYTFIWVCFIGWVISSHKKSHIRISFLTERVGAGARLALGLFADVAVIAFALIFVVKGARLVSNNADIETVTLIFNFWLVYLVVPLSALATIVIVTGDLVARLRGGLDDRREKEIAR